MLKYSHSYPHGIKLVTDSVVRKNALCYNLDHFLDIIKVVEHFIAFECSYVVPVYDYAFHTANNCINYSYSMKRLCILSEEEKKFINHCFKTFYGPIDLTDEVIEGKKNYPALFDLCNKMITDNIYNDRHSGNILKDEFGDYKIIDLEGFNPIKSWKIQP